MPSRRRPFHALYVRAAAAFWTVRGRRALVRGDVSGAIHALERALAWRPGAFKPLMHLTRAYLRQRELYRAHRTLAQARESDPERFDRVVSRWLAGEGIELASLNRVFGAPAGAEGTEGSQPLRAATAVRAPRAAGHPYGDCRDLDEYAHFQAMPPITAAERESVDWDEVLEDLLED